MSTVPQHLALLPEERLYIETLQLKLQLLQTQIALVQGEEHMTVLRICERYKLRLDEARSYRYDPSCHGLVWRGTTAVVEE